MTDTVRRGMSARAILESELFREATLEVEKNILAGWKAGKTPTERESAHARLMALYDVVGYIQNIMKRGDWEAERAETQARREASLPKRKGTE